MNDQIQENEREIEAILAEAVRVAHGYRSASCGPEHLLLAIARTEEGRRAIEDQGGAPRKIVTFLESVFRFLNDGQEEEATTAQPYMELPFDASLRTAIGGAISRTRKAGRLTHFKDLVFELKGLQVDNETFVRALREGGLRDGSLSDDDDLEARMAEFDNECMPDDTFLDARLMGDETDDNGDVSPETEGDAEAAPAPQTPQEEPIDPHDVVARAARARDEHERAVWRSLHDMKAKARQKKTDVVIGRDQIIADVAQALSKRRKPNVILVGEAGTGKTSVVEGLAMSMVEDAQNNPIADRPLYEVSLNDMVAGARFRGDFEARMSHLARIAEELGAILFFDEVHTVMGAGAATARGGMDAANILKPALARGGFSVIGATTPGEMRELRKDSAMMRRFEVLNVLEPTLEETRAIVDIAVADYILHHEINLPDEILDKVVEFADRYIPQRRFPDKAFDLIDATLVTAAQRGVEEAEMTDLRKALARVGGVQLGRPGKERAQRILDLEETLNRRIFGQREAISTLANAASEAAFGLQTGALSASYFLNGPSGVGKTETAEGYAQALGLPFIRVNLSEFSESHSVARLIGSPPGYVGFEEEGLLTAAGETHPEFVIAFDEADKACREVFDVLLQVLDKGILRAGDGREVSFHGAHLFLMANFGQQEAEKATIGFGRQTDKEEVVRETMAGAFRKEFLARINHVVQFTSLDGSVYRDIALTKLDQAARRLRDAGYEIVFSDTLVDHIAGSCTDRAFEARALDARIASEVATPLARAMLAETDAQSFHVDIVDGKVAITSDCAV